ncbi:hypothetical protein F4818DRAFT_423408 [Hypoxylon cercidicola]|nr:hypothetical protein F4818DRAFT_423408 [Hypoxylon cercidicola]
MTSTEDSCILCNKSDTRLCDRCKSIRYCSTTCQHADWPTHKLLCAGFSNFDLTKRPSKEHCRAIFFPVDQKTPQVIWLHCPWHEDEDEDGEEGPNQYPDIELYTGADAFCEIMRIQKASDTIYVCSRDAFLIDGSSRNESVAAITATSSHPSHDWRGPFLAYGKKGLGIDPPDCRDLGMNDFWHITNLFISYGRELQSVEVERRL